MERGNSDDTVYHFRTEEPWRGITNPLGGCVLIELDIMKHEAEVFGAFRFRESGCWHLSWRFDERVLGWELAGAEVGMVEVLPFPSTTIEYVEMLAFGFGKVDNFEVSFNEVSNISEDKRGALLALVFYDETYVTVGGSLHLCDRGDGHLLPDFVTADRGETDRFEQVDLIDHPSDLWLPIDGFQEPTCGGWSNDVIRDSLGFHFGASETGVFAPDVEFDSVGHGLQDGLFDWDVEFRFRMESIPIRVMDGAVENWKAIMEHLDDTHLK